MEHVSMLCAAGTVGIAATGFALGRPETGQKRPSTSRKRRPTLRGIYASPLNRVRDMASPSFRSPLASPTSPRPQTALPLSHASLLLSPGLDSCPQGQGLESAKDETVDGPRSRPRRQTMVDLRRGNPEPQSPGEPSVAIDARRPSSSWLRRLSIITSSNNDSSLTGSCPQSPSVNSSTSPFFASPYPITAPNKLVKRTLSQRGLSSPQQSRFSGPPATTPLLPRPATSHQRSATMRQRSSTESRITLGSPGFNPYNETPAFTPRPEAATDSIWRPFFSPSNGNSSEYLGGRMSAAKRTGRTFRRFIAESNDHPTLLLASSITPEVEERVSRTAHGNSRPVSWNSIQYEQPASNEQAAAATPSVHGVTMQQRKPRQSFSFGDMINGSTTTPWGFGTKKSLRRSRGLSLSQEHSKLHTLESFRSPENDAADESSPGSRRRRNITSPDFFQRPSTASQADLRFHDIDFSQTSPKSRLRRLPNFSELRAELSNEHTVPTSPVNDDSQLPSDEHTYANPTSNSSQPIPAPIRNQRHSGTASDPASTLVGSDNDTRVFSSGDEDEIDFQSDTVFDSFPTRAGVGGQFNSRGPRIDTIFNHPCESDLTCGKLAALQGSFAEVPPTDVPSRQLNHTSESLMNPKYQARQTTQNVELSSVPVCLASHNSAASDVSVPVKEINKAGEESLGIADDMEWKLRLEEREVSPVSWTSPSTTRSLFEHKESADGGKRSLFDWSERDNDAKNPESRPQTVHGKKLLENRGGRAVVRRTPSAIHLRSQSVPLARDPNSSPDSQYISMKFGTWGLGSKGVTEDWDNDFEFDEDSEKQNHSKAAEPISNGTITNHGMKVPQAIMDSQASVHGQFGHVRELTLLVDELKRLHMRANALNIINGPSSDLWKEAKGIINLATSEDDNEDGWGISQHQQPASPVFEDFDFDFPSPGETQNMVKSHAGDTHRSPLSERTNSSCSTPHARRRTESSAKAKLVLDNIYQQRGGHGTDPQQKLAFDTQSLRDLVIRAGAVTRALKEIVRKTEGVCLGPEIDSPRDPPFSQLFTQPSKGITSSPRLRLTGSRNASGPHAFITDMEHNENDPREHMALMAVM
ncbi:hypothetical protein AJ80_07926 [Polytolypa hystricis UAMH7299]|uniref:Uncharacterized protein n=1 Tax=Polytolypa hystricis (strain UAMH7299) TaxID=1447883 RepID=A0A2B7XGA1_POLH7|nr:hypothetical protein AJ80_07926 [Polytolypa hystricis UAMH7299]